MPPRGNATRDAIIHGAAWVFASQPYSQTTISAIAQRAGVKKSAFYFHFTDKAEAAHSVLIEPWPWIPRTIGLDPRGPLEAALDLAFTLCSEHRSNPVVAAGVRLSAVRLDLGWKDETSLEQWRRTVGELLDLAEIAGELIIPAGAAHEILTSSLLGVLLTSIDQSEASARTAVLARLLSPLLRPTSRA
ncbi:TetR/AcrR family transcriptional regulator [Arthrobacter woluwensis]|uniref:TetR/AcrR family transcriptional regulator n=1 Tax=Arthrobacter woluwensis TaxID=156980 RepID=UPI0024680E5A|nr:TetR/AcrR family transcriptional regulator [Arthrobacter woluwensis]